MNEWTYKKITITSASFELESVYFNSVFLNFSKMDAY